jgi:flagellar hook-associated protein 3 FlgL
MSSIPSNLARVSSSHTTNLMLSHLRQSNAQLLKVQEQISSGRRVSRPSDDPAAVSSINLLNRTLEVFEQQEGNLSQAQGLIDTTDQALSDATDILLEAHNIASSQVGIGSTAETRANQAQVISSQLQSMLSLANRDQRGIHLFGGENADVAPFVEAFGGVRYIGPRRDMQADLGLLGELGINTNGDDAFKALSTRVVSSIDLDPQATAATRLVDVNGARGRGVTLGSINLDVDGADVAVDLATADTLGDVVTRVNDAINALDPTAGALAIAPEGFALTANAGHTITISDIGSGVVAQDLGVDLGATGATVSGSDVDPHLTELTTTASLDVPVDLTSGLKITNGSVTKVVGFGGTTTVQEMINAVASADIGVRMEINDARTGFNLVNEVSGTALSIGENSGGSTATDLGLRSFDATTTLGDLNFGKGVETVSGNDLRIHTHDGTDVDVDLSGAATVGEVMAAIEAAAGAAGLAVPADFDMALAADGNGLVIGDNTAGGDSLTVTALNGSRAAAHLGLAGDYGAAPTATGEDVASIRTESVFTHLRMLQEGLLTNDEALITEAGTRLNADANHVASARAQMGVRSRHVDQQSQRLEEQRVQTESLLSGLRDANMEELATRLVKLQQQLEGSYLAGRQVLSLSLLDFLR